MTPDEDRLTLREECREFWEESGAIERCLIGFFLSIWPAAGVVIVVDRLL